MANYGYLNMWSDKSLRCVNSSGGQYSYRVYTEITDITNANFSHYIGVGGYGYVPLYSGSASGLDVNISGTTYHAISIIPVMNFTISVSSVISGYKTIYTYKLKAIGTSMRIPYSMVLTMTNSNSSSNSYTLSANSYSASGTLATITDYVQYVNGTHSASVTFKLVVNGTTYSSGKMSTSSVTRTGIIFNG